ncbi:C-reactive protein-like [Heterodontus francisci]|uniref:C-reactive protein-like n=1 Tax=Heterodontus francisci TaxID=7792 RepID=UPI00355B0425
MKDLIPFVLVACIYLPVSASEGLSGNSLIFPIQTNNSSVKLLPTEVPDLRAFTLCLRVASEEWRSYSLFSYATSDHHNELLLWYNPLGTFSLLLRQFIISFTLPEMNALLRHTCVTWESRTGITTFWVNGQRSIQKVVNQGGIVRGGGTYILGQEQDSVGGGFDIKQCFVGEVTGVDLWDHVLSSNDIKAISQGCHCPGGNIIDWSTLKYVSAGIVTIKDHGDCTV